MINRGRHNFVGHLKLIELSLLLISISKNQITREELEAGRSIFWGRRSFVGHLILTELLLLTISVDNYPNFVEHMKLTKVSFLLIFLLNYQVIREKPEAGPSILWGYRNFVARRGLTDSRFSRAIT